MNFAKRHPAPPLLSQAQFAGLIAGVLLLAATLIVPPPTGLPLAGWQTLGLGLMMAIWWTSEPVPIAVSRQDCCERPPAAHRQDRKSN